ncbi:Esterase, SGNH hydrolase-type [Rhodotorula toruloides NP11]|nr:Esterase, SGNH hydrolase-type [Rhodotorula toruloides NP11]EMS23280.1 Esterase, SGNH hydrolase-type [Rhodotorula toruloides NP11]
MAPGQSRMPRELINAFASAECSSSPRICPSWLRTSDSSYRSRSCAVARPNGAIPRQALPRRMLVASVALISIAALLVQRYGGVGGRFAASLLPILSSSCPHPTRTRPALSPSLTRAIDLPSHSSFSVAVNYDPDACNAFEVSITRSDKSVCATASTIVPSKDEDLARYIKASLGPDTFEVRLEGAERLSQHVPTRFNTEACSYHYGFQLNNPGRVYLHISHLFVDYHGYREDSPHVADPFPDQPLRHSVLDSKTPVELSLCSMCEGINIATSSPAPHLPQCDMRITPPGTYVPSPLALQRTLNPLDYGLPTIDGRPLAGLYDWTPQECRWDHAGLRGRDHAPCLTNPHRALFVGDSHARVLAEATAHRLLNRQGMLNVTVKAGSRPVMGNLTFQVVWDPYAEFSGLWDCPFLARYDSVLFDVGTHSLAWHCNATSIYTTLLRSALQGVADCAKQAPTLRPGRPAQRLLFLTMPPHFNNKLRKQDCRTEPRIARWNELGRDLAVEFGWDVLDFYRLAAPITPDIYLGDGTHYLKTDAIEPLVDQYLGMLGICDGR